MPETTFDITRYENRNGVHSWRVCGWLHGVRIRKNFKNRDAAIDEMAALERRALRAASGVRNAPTFLTDDQLREAESAFRRLGDRPQSLSLHLDYALAHYRPPEREQPVATAVGVYLAAKTREQERSVISFSQTNSIRKELSLLQATFPGHSVSQLTPPGLTSFCDRGMPSLKTYNNRRGILSTFFKYALQQDWIGANPIEKVPHHRIAHRRGSAKTLTAAQAETLMRHIETVQGGALVPFFALCLFAGIRPCVRAGEIIKLQPGHIQLDTGVIHIEPEVSKVRMKRNVTIQPNLAAWLQAYPTGRLPIIPPNLQHARAHIAKAFGLTHDVMRHTLISMFVGKFRSMGEAALQAGNSESIIRKHYLDLKSPAEAEAFFAIMPTRVPSSSTGMSPTPVPSSAPITIAQPVSFSPPTPAAIGRQSTTAFPPAPQPLPHILAS